MSCLDQNFEHAGQICCDVGVLQMMLHVTCCDFRVAPLLFVRVCEAQGLRRIARASCVVPRGKGQNDASHTRRASCPEEGSACTRESQNFLRISHEYACGMNEEEGMTNLHTKLFSFFLSSLLLSRSTHKRFSPQRPGQAALTGVFPSLRHSSSCLARIGFSIPTFQSLSTSICVEFHQFTLSRLRPVDL